MNRNRRRSERRVRKAKHARQDTRVARLTFEPLEVRLNFSNVGIEYAPDLVSPAVKSGNAPTAAVTDAGGSYTGLPYAATATVDSGSSLEGVTPAISYYSGSVATGSPLSGAPVVAGTYTALASFAGSTDYTSAAASATFTISPSSTSPITATAESINATVGESFNGLVATFTDANPNEPLSNFPLSDVTINWGDGTTTNATSITQPGGVGTAFQVYGTHTYGQEGGFAVSVSIQDSQAVSPFVSGIDSPQGLAFDSNENLYVADNNAGTVTQITPGGTASTFASGFNQPQYLAFDSSGNLYVSNGLNAGIVNVLNSSGQNIKTIYSLYYPEGLAFDSSGDLFIAQRPGGWVSEVTAGGTWNANYAYVGEYNPNALAMDSEGNLYVADQYSNTVSKITPAGVVSTFAVGFDSPSGLAFDSSGNLYVANAGNSTISKVTPAGVVTTFVSTGLDSPQGLAFDSSGNLYVANNDNGTITRIAVPTMPTVSSTALVADAPIEASVVSGSGSYGSSFNGLVATFTDGNPTAPLSEFPLSGVTINWGDGSNSNPTSITQPGGAGTTFDIYGTHSYAQAGNYTVSVSITDTGAISTFASGLSTPEGLAFNGAGNLYIANSGNGTIETVSPGGSTGTYYSGFNSPEYLTFDSSGDLYVSGGLNAGYVDKVDGGGTDTHVLIYMYYPDGVVLDSSGDLFVAQNSYGMVSEYTADNVYIGSFASLGDYSAYGLAFSGGYLYASAAYQATIDKIDSQGNYTVFASGFDQPAGIAFDSSGDLFVANAGNNTVSEVSPGGVVSTFLSTGLNTPQGLAFDASGNLYVSNETNGTVIRVAVPSLPGSTGTASNTFSISQVSPTVGVSDSGGTYDASAFTATATVNSSASLEGVTPSLSYFSGSSASGTALSGAPANAGTYTVLASFAGSTDYTTAAASVLFTITQATPTVTVSDSGGTYDGSPFPATGATVTGVGSDGTIASFGSPLISYLYYQNGAPLSGAPSSAGSYAIVAVFAGNQNYTSAESAEVGAPGSPGDPLGQYGDAYGYRYKSELVREVGQSMTFVTAIDVLNLQYYDGGGGSFIEPAPPGSPYAYLIRNENDGQSHDVTLGVVEATGFSIAQTTPTVAVTDNGGPYTGAAFPATASPIEGVTPTVSYYSGTSVSGAALSGVPSAVGTYTALASFAGSTDYTSGTGSVPFTITPGTPTVLVSDSGGTYTGMAFPATAAAIEGVTPTISYYSGSSATGTALSGVPSTAGTYTALASFAGSSDYASGSGSAIFTIGKATPAVAVNDSGGTYTGNPFPATSTVTGVGSQSLAAASLEGVTPTISYYAGTSATGSPLSGPPSTVGSYTVVASFAGSTDYTSAVSSITFAPTTASPTVTVTASNASFTGGPYTPSAPSIEGVAPTFIYYSGTAATGTPLSGAPTTAGTYTVLVSFAGSTDYSSGTTNATFTISPATPTLTVVDGGGNFNGSSYPATATVAGVGSQSTAESSLEGVTPTLTYYSGTAATGTALAGAPSALGTYTVLAQFAGSADYASTSATTSFSIVRGSLTLTITDGGPYTSYAQPATALINGSASLEGVTPLLHYYSGTSVTGNLWSTSPPSLAGTYSVLASFAGSTDYGSAVNSLTFSITKAVPTVTVVDAGGQYTGRTMPAMDTVAGVGSQSAAGSILEGVSPTLVYYTGASASGSPLGSAPSAVGTYTAVASFSGSADYASTSASVTFTIAGLTVPTLTVTDNGGAYTDAAQPAMVQVNGAGSLQGVTPIAHYYTGTSATGNVWTTTAPSLAGTYTVLASFAGSTNYASTQASQTFSITKAAPTVTIADAGGLYSGSTFPATDSVAGVGNQSTASSNLETGSLTLTYYSGTAATGSASATAPSAAGTYTAVASFSGSADYAAATASITFTIAAKPAPTVTVSDSGGTYTSYGQPATAQVDNSGSLQGVTPLLHYFSGTSATGNLWTTSAPSLVGTYTVLASFAGSTSYGSAQASQTFTISKATPTIALSDAGGSYSGGTFPASDQIAGLGSQSTSAYSLEGVSLVLTYYSGTAATGTPLSGAPSAIGTYTVLASFAGSPDYTSASKSLTFEIHT